MRIGERITENRLHLSSGNRQGGTCHDCGNQTRKPELQHYSISIVPGRGKQGPENISDTDIERPGQDIRHDQQKKHRHGAEPGYRKTLIHRRRLSKKICSSTPESPP